MYKIGVIGDRDSVLAFRAVGMDVKYVEGQAESIAALREFAAGNYAVVFVTENVAAMAEEEIDKYRETVMPAVITLPNNQGSTGLGMAGIQKSVERAVGADIFGGEN